MFYACTVQVIKSDCNMAWVELSSSSATVHGE